MPSRLLLALLGACLVTAAGSADAAPRLVHSYSLEGVSRGVIAVPEEPGQAPLVAVVAEQGGARDDANLVRSLAENGFAAVAFEPGRVGYVRAFDAHLRAIEEAAAGQGGQVGVDLDGRVDPRRVGVFARSRAVVPAVALARRTRPTSLLLVAPAGISGDVGRPLPDMPFALVLPQCDGVANGNDGRGWYDAARLSKRRTNVAEYVLLHGANHDFFAAHDAVDDAGGLRSRPGCDAAQRLRRDDQQRWLERYAAAFFRGTLAYKAPAVGLDPSRPAPSRIFGARVTTALVVPVADRLVMRYPRRPRGDLAGGNVVTSGPIFARACLRSSATCVPSVGHGKPLQLRLAWEGTGAAYTILLPAERADLTHFVAVSLRVAAEVNGLGKLPSFSVVLRDGAGRAAGVVVRPPEVAKESTADGSPSLLGAFRIPLRRFRGIDLRDVSEVGLEFDRTPAGTVFVEDLELLADPPLVAAVHALPRTLTRTGDRIRQVLQLWGRGEPTLEAVLTDQTGVRVQSRRIRRLPVGRRSVSLPLPTLLPGAYRLRYVWRGVVESNPVAFRVVAPVHAEVVSIVRGAGRRIALTFDDCLYPSAWARMLNTLRAHDAHATFFCNGRNLSGQAELMRATIEDGNAVGSHTWSHTDLRSLTTAGIERETNLDSDVWWRDAEADPRPFLRPPYGSYDEHVLKAAGRTGHRYVVLWDVDTNDWQKPGPRVIARRALEDLSPGAIVLLHVLPQTAAALPAILDGLAARGFEAVSLNELLAVPGGEPSNGHWSATAAPRP